MAPLPGPDQPPRAKKNPKIVKRYTVKPARVPAGLILRKRGGGLGYVTVRKAPPKKVAPPPVPPPGSYPEYARFPSFQRELQQMDRDQAHHQTYVSEKVQPWVGQALTNLTGVDPNAPGIGPTLQGQYRANIEGIVGGAYGASGAATPMMPGATTPGGIMASPTAYLSGAAREYAGGMTAGAVQRAQSQATLNTLQSNLHAQGVVRQIADLNAGLPALYAERRNERRSKMDEFILNFEEGNRRARVSESISAMNAQANIAISLGNLGLDAQDTQRRLDEATAEQQQYNAEANAPAPHGYFRDVDGSLVRDPSVPQATAGGGAGGGKGRRTPVQIRQSGGASIQIVGPWPKKPKPMKGITFEQATDGKWYGTRVRGEGSGGTASKPAKAMGFGSLVSDIGKKWSGSGSGPFGSGTPGWGETLRGDQAGIAQALADWVIENRSSFNTRGGKFDPQKVLKVLATLGDGSRKWALINPILQKRIKNGKLT